VCSHQILLTTREKGEKSMWTCPKCGSAFKEQTHKHLCNPQATPIDDYIAVQPEAIQPILYQVRDKIRTVLPEVQERISWRMPTYWKDHNIIHFAAHKNHIGLYPGPEAIEHFSDQLQAYKSSKGAIQFPYEREIPLDLIGHIAQWCYETGHHH
jgi:uncharacterized protein YdhG (YjbR/CyaY superfamily)